jgi:hypothetical protein
LKVTGVVDEKKKKKKKKKRGIGERRWQGERG